MSETRVLVYWSHDDEAFVIKELKGQEGGEVVAQEEESIILRKCRFRPNIPEDGAVEGIWDPRLTDPTFALHKVFGDDDNAAVGEHVGYSPAQGSYFVKESAQDVMDNPDLLYLEAAWNDTTASLSGIVWYMKPKSEIPQKNSIEPPTPNELPSVPDQSYESLRCPNPDCRDWISVSPYAMEEEDYEFQCANCEWDLFYDQNEHCLRPVEEKDL